MKKREIEKIVFHLLLEIAPEVDPEELEMDDNIQEVLGIDSFDFLQFIVKLEEEFKIKTPEEDYGKIRTLGTLIPYIMRGQKQFLD